MPLATRFMGGKYLTVEAIEKMSAKERKTTIDHISVEAISGKEKLVAFFEGIDEGLPLNVARIESLIELHGGVEDTDNWRGTKVELYVDPSVKYQGRRVGGVAIKAQE